MNHHINISEDINRLLQAHRLYDALDLLDNTSLAIGAVPEVRSATARVRESYELMSHYALQGAPDPQRPVLYESLCDEIRSLADTLHRLSRIDDAPKLYFSTLRMCRLHRDITVAALVGEYRRINERLNLSMLAEEVHNAHREFTRRAEDLEKQIFNHLWVTHPLSVDDMATVGNVLSSPALSVRFKIVVISAVMLGALEYYDEKRLRILMDACKDSSPEVSIRALCALMVAMWHGRNRHLSSSLSARLDDLREMPSWSKDIRMVTLQFLRSRDTEKITRRFTDELIPEMMKLKPEIEKLGTLPQDPEAIEENPEWAELLDKSGIADKLKEMQELQEDGGDVMMATFKNLKTFPFFNEPVNWFIPFDPSHSVVGESAHPSVEIMAEILASSPAFCDNDKYSIILSLSQIPASQLEMMTSQIKAHSAQMAEITASHLVGSDKDRELIAQRFVQDIYRFFHIFRRKGEFANPFASGINPAGIPAFSAGFEDADTLRLVGEFHFRHGHYDDAFDCFDALSFKTPPSAEIFQKMGYCRHAMGNIPEAIKYYEQSELLSSESRWTIRRLAACHRRNGNPAKALEYYKRLAADPASGKQDASLALNIGLCLMLTGKFEEAIAQFYKVEFLQGESDKSSRPMVRCALLAGDLDRAAKYNDLLLSRNPSASDFLEAGHIALLRGKIDDAASRYAQSLAKRNFARAEFSEALAVDIAAIPGLSDFDRLTLDIVVDAALRRAAGLGSPI